MIYVENLFKLTSCSLLKIELIVTIFSITNHKQIHCIVEVVHAHFILLSIFDVYYSWRKLNANRLADEKFGKCPPSITNIASAGDKYVLQVLQDIFNIYRDMLCLKIPYFINCVTNENR